ncbi:hypothetical protein [Sorangium sp. So ce233]|uniref:hypothetical protein n=1 Tax=Sorangium sp. So ce233 TaxID=3133290 RepID=UPI003F63408B
MEAFQYHLKGKGFSGRGVRLRQLDQPELDAAFLSAAKVAGAEASMADIRVREQHDCVLRMILEVTEKRDLETLDGAAWRKVTHQELEDEEGSHRFSKLFTAKDTAFLRRMYREWHNLSEAEAEAIAGNGLPVSAD